MRRSIASARLLLFGFIALAGGCAHHHHHRVADDPNLTQADLPGNVEKTFQRDHATATVKQIDRRVTDRVVQYRITYVDPDGTRHQAFYDREGDSLDTQTGGTPNDAAGGESGGEAGGASGGTSVGASGGASGG